MPNALPTHKPHKQVDARVKQQALLRQASRFLHTASKQWRAIRKAQLEQYPLCEDCHGPANEVDHNTDDTSRNTIGLELSSLCKPCHSARTRARQHGRPQQVKGCDVDGWPLDPEHHWNQARKSPETSATQHAAQAPRTPPRIDLVKK